MKKIYPIFYALLLILTIQNNLKAQDVSIPDNEFRGFLISKYPSCFVNVDGNGNLMMNTNCSEIVGEDSLEFHIRSTIAAGINIEGIQYFTSLIYLDCSNTIIQSSPSLPASLKYVNFSQTYPEGFVVPTLDIFPNGLRYLDISINSLSTLPPSLPDSLRVLNCFANRLSYLPPLPSKLDTLICSFNRNPYANYLSLLTSLPSLPPNLRYLDCSDNAFSTLPQLNEGLTYLDCSRMQVEIDQNGLPDVSILFNLPPLPSSLKHLLCGFNALTSLPVLPNGLLKLNCNQNINLKCLPHLSTSLDTLIIYATGIKCLPNSGDYYVDTQKPLCNIANNINGCNSDPIISGNIFYDNNSNGNKDADESYRANVKVQLSNGRSAFSTLDGHYELSGEIGTNTLTVEAPQYYAAVPSVFTYSFNSNDTMVNELIALQPTISVDSFAISIVATTAARPGFSLSYLISYENVGTTTVSPNIEFNYNNTVLTYNSSNNSSVVNTGSTLTLAEVNLIPGQRKNFTANFTVSRDAVRGDTLNANASIAVNSTTSSDITFSVITGSYDPNDKQGTPKLNPEQVAEGKYIDYLIRFQNTGTDTAFNIVVTDTLNPLLDVNSLQLINTSHPARITKKDNEIGFEFLNIQLPDSIVNEPASHGFIRFRIKPQSSVTLNTVIPNEASIYFDYNTPIVTNTAVTSIIVDPAVCFNLSTTSTPASCAGISNGSITVTPNGGTAPFHYSLDSGTSQSSGLFTGVGAGIHTILVTDDNGCTSLKNVTVTSGPGVIATVTSTQPTCSEQGIIQIAVSDGTAPFLYSINGGAMQSGSTFSNLSAGIYSVLVQDSNMCSYTESVTINSAPPTFTPTVTITSSANSVCAGETVTIAAAFSNGGTTPSFQWIVNGVNEGTNSATLIISPMENVDVSVQLTSNDPCASQVSINSNSVSITVNPVQTAFITIAGNTILSAGTASLINSTVFNGGTSASYQWQDSTSAHSWTNISGAINSTIDFAPQQTGDGLRCVLTSTFTCPASTITTSNALYFTIDASLVPRVRLYPNPVRSILTIENNGQTQWVNGDIINENGRKVFTITNSFAGSEVRLDVSRLPAGVYFIRLTDNNGLLNYFKFIKQ